VFLKKQDKDFLRKFWLVLIVVTVEVESTSKGLHLLTYFLFYLFVCAKQNNQ